MRSLPPPLPPRALNAQPLLDCELIEDEATDLGGAVRSAPPAPLPRPRRTALKVAIAGLALALAGAAFVARPRALADGQRTAATQPAAATQLVAAAQPEPSAAASRVVQNADIGSGSLGPQATAEQSNAKKGQKPSAKASWRAKWKASRARKAMAKQQARSEE
jgi:hypothetical protein